MKNDIFVAIVALAPGARRTQEGADETERYFSNRIYNPRPQAKPGQLCEKDDSFL